MLRNQSGFRRFGICLIAMITITIFNADQGMAWKQSVDFKVRGPVQTQQQAANEAGFFFYNSGHPSELVQDLWIYFDRMSFKEGRPLKFGVVAGSVFFSDKMIVSMADQAQASIIFKNAVKMISDLPNKLVTFEPRTATVRRVVRTEPWVQVDTLPGKTFALRFESSAVDPISVRKAIENFLMGLEQDQMSIAPFTAIILEKFMNLVGDDAFWSDSRALGGALMELHSTSGAAEASDYEMNDEEHYLAGFQQLTLEGANFGYGSPSRPAPYGQAAAGTNGAQTIRNDHNDDEMGVLPSGD